MAPVETSHHLEIASGWPLRESADVVGDRLLRAAPTSAVLNDAPREAAQALRLRTVLVSRVMQDGAWIPWSRYGEDPASGPGVWAWPASTPVAAITGDDLTVGPDEIHPAVATVLARWWVLAPIERHQRLIGFLHANPGTCEPGAIFSESCGMMLWQPLWLFAEQLAARCERVERRRRADHI
jgi:hypothetical protein